MSKRTLRLIITLMSFAMIGLILFQVYWINNAIRVNETQFRQHVHDALNSVIANLERNEVYYAASRRFFNPPQKQIFLRYDSNVYTGPTFDNTSPFVTENDPSVHGFEWSTDLRIEDSIFFGSQQITISYEVKSGEAGEMYTRQDEIMRERLEPDQSIKENINRQARQNVEKIAQKSQMVTVVLDELLGQPKNINNRLSKDQLEKMLDLELKNRGIELQYEYAVIDRNRNQLLFANYEEPNKKEVLNSDFSSRLFPNDLRAGENYLALSFPEESRYLLQSVGLPLASSILLALLIIFLFGYAIYAIIMQKKVSEIKNDFINNMTHEFKTPISTVALACEALQDQEIQRNRTFVNKYIQVIRDENKRLGHQVEKVLQMATLDKKEFKLKYEEVNIHAIIDKALANIELQINQKNGMITKRLIASNHIITSDELHLTNIIYNLLDNANKYSFENPEIGIQTEDHHQGVLIRISDKGIGMKQDEIEKIFEKFYRVPTGNLHDVKGFGLGLTYVKTILAALGGYIKVKSEPGKGSTFEMILPLNHEKN